MSARDISPETRILAAMIRELREGAGLSETRAADVTGTALGTLRAYETAAFGVPAVYVRRLLRASGTPVPVFVDMLFASGDRNADDPVPAPLPPDATLLESALRMWRLGPVAAKETLRQLVADALADTSDSDARPALTLVRS